jgi:TRAP transporter TAXI family solute receptor
MNYMLLVALVCWTTLASAAERITYKIVTGSERGTYIQIGRDLATLVAAPAGLKLSVLPSKGSPDNVNRLRYEPGVKFALVQSDVYQAMLDEAKAGNASAAQIIRPLRVIMPLYDEEIYFVVPADSPLTYIHELKGRKINIGPLGSGSALSAMTLYRQMFQQPLTEGNSSFLSNEDALLKLSTDKSIDAAVIVAGQPAKLFAEMRPEARRFIKFLRRDPRAAETARVDGTYFPASIRASSYPNWLATDVPTLSVKAFLVTYDFEMAGTRRVMSQFATAVCHNFDSLQHRGHPKWQQVSLNLPPLGKGWSYYGPTEKVLRECLVNGRPADTAALGVAGTSASARAVAPVR